MLPTAVRQAAQELLKLARSFRESVSRVEAYVTPAPRGLHPLYAV